MNISFKHNLYIIAAFFSITTINTECMHAKFTRLNHCASQYNKRNICKTGSCRTTNNKKESTAKLTRRTLSSEFYKPYGTEEAIDQTQNFTPTEFLSVIKDMELQDRLNDEKNK